MNLFGLEIFKTSNDMHDAYNSPALTNRAIESNLKLVIEKLHSTHLSNAFNFVLFYQEKFVEYIHMLIAHAMTMDDAIHKSPHFTSTRKEEEKQFNRNFTCECRRTHRAALMHWS